MAKTPLNSILQGRAAVVRHMQSLADLSSEEVLALNLSLLEATQHESREQLIALDAPLDAPFFVLSGWVARTASRSNGSRQIIDVYIAGDLAGYSSRPGALAAANYECLTNAVTTSAAALARSAHGNGIGKMRLRVPFSLAKGKWSEVWSIKSRA